MGLFVLPLGKTWIENVKDAEANLRLLAEDDYRERSDYLIAFAISCLLEAQKKLNTNR